MLKKTLAIIIILIIGTLCYHYIYSAQNIKNFKDIIDYERQLGYESTLKTINLSSVG